MQREVTRKVDREQRAEPHRKVARKVSYFSFKILKEIIKSLVYSFQEERNKDNAALGVIAFTHFLDLGSKCIHFIFKSCNY